MNGRWIFRTFFVLLAPLAIASRAPAQEPTRAPAIGGGGGPAASASMLLAGTVGQTCTGRITGVATGMQQGFWYSSARTSAAPARSETMISGASMTISPNPLAAAGRLRVTLPKRGSCLLRIADARGTVIATLVHGVHDAGAFDIGIDAATLPTGEYSAILTFDETTTRTPFIIMR